MTKDEALDLALEALEYIDLCDNDRDFLHPHECFQLDEAITAIKQARSAPVQEPTLQEQLDDALSSLDFYKRRADALQQWQSKMRDPERTIVCDILANGHTLEPAGERYTPPAAQWQALAAPVQEPVASVAYDMVDRFLRNNLSSDADYAEYSAALDALYTTPPAAQRQWVGLTDEERTEIRREHYARTLPLIDAVETKLKEKNNG
jgi:hypothetical protein